MILYYIRAIIATVIYGIATLIAMLAFFIGMISRDTARMGMWFDPDKQPVGEDSGDDSC